MDHEIRSLIYQEDQQFDVAIDGDVKNRIIRKGQEGAQNIEDESFDETRLDREPDTSFVSGHDEYWVDSSARFERFSLSKYPLALIHEDGPDWFKALDMGSPRRDFTPRSPLEWLNLGVLEEQILVFTEEDQCNEISGMEILQDETSFYQAVEEGSMSEESMHIDAAKDTIEVPLEDQTEEEIDADHFYFCGSRSPAYIAEENSTDNTSDNPEFEYLAMSSKDDRESKKAKPDSVISLPMITEEIAETNAFANWLKSPGQIHEQERVAGAGTSSEIDTDEQLQNEISAINCEAEFVSSVSYVESKLAEALIVVDQYESSSEDLEEMNESVPLSPSLSDCFVSTNVFQSSASVTVEITEEAIKTTGLDNTESKAVQSESPETVNLASYMETLAACNHINKLATEESAWWEDVSVSLHALESFLSKKFSFPTTSEKNLSKRLSKTEKEGTHIFRAIPIELANNEPSSCQASL